jgi:osmotically-inducible protein OsmY
MADMVSSPPRTDDAIREDVLRELKSDPKITSPDIGVAGKDGVVTLSGFVSSYWEKEQVERAAKRVDGVRAVANDLQVKFALSRTDPEIAHDALHELESHVSIPSEDIKVTVQNGWVTLEGTVDGQYQRELAESTIKKLKGVLGVTNNIEVKPPLSISEIKEKIEEALKRNAESDLQRITIEVDDATVKLYGSVGSLEEKEEAERAAWSAPGIVQVENYITVAP